MSASESLSAEVIETVLSFLLPSSTLSPILSFAYVSRAWRAGVRRVLFTSLAISSTSSTRLLLRSLASAPELQLLSRRLTFVRGARRRPASTRKGKCVETVEDAVTPEDVVLLATRLSIESLALRELAFQTFRRRQVNFTLNLPTALTALSILGRVADEGFNMHTVGQIVSNLPSLTHLALRHIQAVPSALSGLVLPTCTLSSLALLDTPCLEAAQLRWLLRSTTHAETLRHLAITWHADSPRALNPVRYAALRVSHFAVSTTTPGVPESLALHFPSLRVLQLQSTQSIDPKRLFGNLEGPLEYLVDRSKISAGVDPGELAMVLRRAETVSVEGLRAVRVVRTSEELVMACVGVGARLEVRESRRDGSEPYIPPRRVHLSTGKRLQIIL